MYKTLKLPMGEMTFLKDFINDNRGDLYPVIAKDNECIERLENNRYRVQNGTVERMFTRFFPYATYEISFSELKGGCGFVFHLADQKASLICRNDAICFFEGENEQKFVIDNRKEAGKTTSEVIKCYI